MRFGQLPSMVGLNRKTGALIRAADEAGFSLMVTCDQNIRYQQNMRMRAIGRVVLSTNHWPTLRAGAKLIVDAIGHQPRGYAYVECGMPPRRRRSLESSA